MASKLKSIVNAKLVKKSPSLKGGSALATAVSAFVAAGKEKANAIVEALNNTATANGDGAALTVDTYVEAPIAAPATDAGTEAATASADNGSAKKKKKTSAKSKAVAVAAAAIDVEAASSTLSQPAGIRCAMMPHQIAGLNWLAERYRMGINCILADEMGLGKTLQSLCLLAHINERHAIPGPFLVICPLTVVDNWINEIKQFCTKLTAKAYMGDKKVRTAMQQSITEHVLTQTVAQRKSDPQLPPDCQVLVTTYDLAMNDKSFLSRFKWKAVIIDEAHRLKNSEAILYNTLMDEYKLEYKLLLTGTPCQNNLGELWSLLHFLHPKLFTDKKGFATQYGAVTRASQSTEEEPSESTASSAGGDDSEDAKTGNSYTGFFKVVLGAVSELHAVIRPFMLRRLKEQVNLKIPPAREVVVYTGLSDLQKQYYKFVLTKNASAMGAGNSRSLLNVIMALRKCVNHPYLFTGAEPEPFFEGDHIFEASGKFTVIDKLLHELKAAGRRVLMFSTSVQTLDILQDYLTYRQFSYERLDGSVRGEERFLAIERFQKDEETFVFLLSTRAGGIGLNLVQADTVIFVDSDWNPQIDLQAQARVHRIGQKNKVLVIRLIAANTVEEIIQTRTAQKLKMTKLIIEKGKFHRTDDASDDKSKKAADDKDELASASSNDLKKILQFGLDRIFENAGTPTISDDEIKTIIHGPTDATAAAAAAATDEPTVIGRDEKEIAASAAAAAAVPSSLTSSVGSASQWSIADTAEPEFKVPAPKAPKGAAAAAAAAAAAGDSKKPTPTKRKAMTSIYEFEGQDYSQSQSLDPSSLGSAAMLPPESAASESAGSLPVVGWDTDPSREAKSKAVLESLMIAGGATVSSLTSEDATPGLANATRTKRGLTTDEVAARHAARKAADDEKKKAAAKKREEKAKRAAEIKIQNWKEAGYVSFAVQLDEKEAAAATEGDAMNIDGDGDADVSIVESGAAAAADDEKLARINQSSQLFYEVGDASKPNFSAAPRNLKVNGSIILNCADDSGIWPNAGFFRALNSVSPLVAQGYTAAGGADDLHLGDAHMIHIDTPATATAADAKPDTKTSSPAAAAAASSSSSAAAAAAGDESGASVGSDLYVCHIVAQKRKKTGGVSGIQYDALTLALRKVCQVAKSLNLAVHLPRIGANTFDFNWYGIERILKKYLASRGVPTFVYYYKNPARMAAASRVPSYGRVASASFASPAKPATASAYANPSDDPDFGVSDFDDQNAAIGAVASFDTNADMGTAESAAAASSAAAAAASVTPEQKRKPTAADRTAAKRKAGTPSPPPPAAAAAVAATNTAKVVDRSASGNQVTMKITKREWEAFQRQKAAAAQPAAAAAPADDDGDTDAAAAARPVKKVRADSGTAAAVSSTNRDVFASVTAFLDPRIDTTQSRLLTRYLTAYGGSVESETSKLVTHIITTSGCAHIDSALRALKYECGKTGVNTSATDVAVVALEWIELCMKAGHLITYADDDAGVVLQENSRLFADKRFYLHFPASKAAPAAAATSLRSSPLRSPVKPAAASAATKHRVSGDVVSYGGVLQAVLDGEIDYVITDVDVYDEVLRRAALDYHPPPAVVNLKWLTASLDANTALDPRSQPALYQVPKSRQLSSPAATTKAAAAAGARSPGGAAAATGATTTSATKALFTSPNSSSSSSASAAAVGASSFRSPSTSLLTRAERLPPAATGLHSNSPLQSLVDH